MWALFWGELPQIPPQAEPPCPLLGWQCSWGEPAAFYPTPRRPQALQERGGGTGRPGSAEMPFAVAAMAPSRLPQHSHGTGPPHPRGEAGGPASRERGEKSPQLLIWLLSPCCDPMARPAWRGSASLLQQPLSEAPSLAENVLIL